MKVSRTRTGLRLGQHGVVISELRTSPGPTHSVFDLLAALAAELAPSGSRARILGFAGGGMMAPLRGLGFGAPIESVDLDRTGYELFRRDRGEWAGKVRWEQADAMDWLRRQKMRFGTLVDDLSVPERGDPVEETARSFRHAIGQGLRQVMTEFHQESESRMLALPARLRVDGGRTLSVRNDFRPAVGLAVCGAGPPHYRNNRRKRNRL